jgi:hypothetical protein
MAPYLRPEVMGEVLPVLIGANEFFDDPVAEREFLDEQRVEYLVVVAPGPWIGSPGGRVPKEGDAEAVAAVPNMKSVFEDNRVTIFAVGAAQRGSEARQPARCPL